jgi:hypothetical protein
VNLLRIDAARHLVRSGMRGAHRTWCSASRKAARVAYGFETEGRWKAVAGVFWLKRGSVNPEARIQSQHVLCSERPTSDGTALPHERIHPEKQSNGRTGIAAAHRPKYERLAS